MITALPRIALAVTDFDAAVATFRDGFGMPVVDHSERTAASLGARVGMAVPEGGSNIELMSPADPAKPLSQALQKFLDRRGDGIYAMMLEAPDPNAEAAELAARGLGVLDLMAGAAGRDVHPHSTCGVLIRVYPDRSAPPPKDRRGNAPHLSGITRAVLATSDVAAAAQVYGRGFGLAVGPVTVDEARGVDVAICTPPEGGVVELVAARDVTRPYGAAIAEFVKDTGGGMFTLGLTAADPDGAASLLGARGLQLDDGGEPGVVVFGTRFVFDAPAG